MKKLLLIVPGVVVLAALIAHFAWKYSGSGQEELVIERDGIRIYATKTPGAVLKRIRAVREVDTTLERAVAGMLDGSLENCIDWSARCTASEVVVPWDPQKQYYVQLWRKTFPAPFAPREFVLRTQYSSDPATGGASIEFIAEPDKLPLDDCCYRVAHMHTVWRMVPVGPNRISVELSQDIDVGLPYVMFNQRSAEGVFAAFSDLPRLFGKAKYDGVTLDSLLLQANAPAAAEAGDGAAEAATPAS